MIEKKWPSWKPWEIKECGSSSIASVPKSLITNPILPSPDPYLTYLCPQVHLVTQTLNITRFTPPSPVYQKCNLTLAMSPLCNSINILSSAPAHSSSSNTFWYMNYYSVWFLVQSGQTDRQTDRKRCKERRWAQKGCYLVPSGPLLATGTPSLQGLNKEELLNTTYTVIRRWFQKESVPIPYLMPEVFITRLLTYPILLNYSVWLSLVTKWTV